MPTIRDVVRALGGRDGVDAVIVLGRDGLPIDSHATDGIDTESVAALVPTVVGACNRLGSASGRGEFGTSVVEYDGGMIMVTGLTEETLLAILVAPSTNIGALLYEIHRHRSAIADLL